MSCHDCYCISRKINGLTYSALDTVCETNIRALLRDETPPALTGSTVWISGSDSDGYDVSLSADTRNKVRGVLDGCGEQVDDKCYQDVVRVLESSELQIDSQLDRRHFGHMLSKTFRGVSARVGGIAAFFLHVSKVLLSQWHIKHSDEEFSKSLFLPHSKVSTVTVLATATTIVVSADGQAIVTITQVPETATLQGSKATSVTAVTTAHGPFVTGDFAAVLDANLASRLDEIMHRMTDCADGRDFDSGKTLRRRAGPGYGAAICAVEGVAAMAQPGGAMGDLLLLNPGQVRFGFAAGAGDIARAAGVAVGFVQAYAPMLNLPDDVAIQLGNFLFALAVDTLINNLPLAEENRIEATLLTTETMATSTPTSTTSTSSTSSGCPDPTSTPLICGNDDKDNCEVELPKEPGGDAKCKSGEYQGCMCYTPQEVYINMASNEEQLTMLLTWNLLGHQTSEPPQAAEPVAKCDVKYRSGIPGNVFGGPTNNVYHNFCDKWVAGIELKMTVDALGNDRAPVGQLMLRPRVPPQDPSNYMYYNIDLGFKPSVGGKKCVYECTQAFGQITSGCSNAGSKVQVMQTTGSIDVDCGVFEYSITPPSTTPLVLQNRNCYGANDFGSHKDIHESEVRKFSSMACAGTARTPIRSDDPSSNRRFATFDNKQPIQYKIYWKEGCVLEPPGGEEIYPSNPLASKDAGSTYCQGLLIDNFKKCNNGGVGGNIQAGCLVYDFKAKHD
ncbi:hypothetical protein BKA65DRAFT_596796 [Rhexocercosporidium sp. MPI-PUGE-AT-0058]|nr:hypothetical protein BKA65DRAFT_596796 [Rhexocercosporidium sp. MPI-PUGE-AT-0058]